MNQESPTSISGESVQADDKPDRCRSNKHNRCAASEPWSQEGTHSNRCLPKQDRRSKQNQGFN